MESELEESFPSSTYDCNAFDPVKTRFSNSQAGAEELTNHNASCQALRVQHFDYDSDNLVFSGW